MKKDNKWMSDFIFLKDKENIEACWEVGMQEREVVHMSQAKMGKNL